MRRTSEDQIRESAAKTSHSLIAEWMKMRRGLKKMSVSCLTHQSDVSSLKLFLQETVWDGSKSAEQS